VKRIRARNVEDAGQISRQTVVESGSAGSIMSVKVNYPRISRRFGIFVLNMSGLDEDVELVITAPVSMHLALNAASGSVAVRNMSGGVELDLTSGDAQLMDLRGPLDCSLTSGDLEVRNADGPVTVRGTSADIHLADIRRRISAHTSSGDVVGVRLAGGEVSTISGDVRLRNVGPVSVHTTSGEVTVAGGTGRAIVKTISGDVSLDTRPGPQDAVEVSSTSGTVALQLPAGTGLDLSVRTSSGEVVSRLPVRVKHVSRTSFEGRVEASGRGERRKRAQKSGGATCESTLRRARGAR
jgi:DUF4097 and DUF4098 domain-containing protein YvlB